MSRSTALSKTTKSDDLIDSIEQTVLWMPSSVATRHILKEIREYKAHRDALRKAIRDAKEELK